VTGTVADAQGGEPLARVRVQLAGAGRETVTDAAGRFSLANLPAGEYTLHVSTVGYRLLTRGFTLAAGETKEFEVALSPDTFRHADSVEVKSGPFDLAREDSPSERTLSGLETKNLASVLADDPLRSVQAMPGVTSNDDFEARFSLRGAGYHRVGFYLDGTLLHTPFHTLNQQSSGSLTVFNGDLVEDLGLHPGAWPGRYGDRTGGVLDVHSREGSRSEPHFRATASFSNVGVMGEGPLGKRGSWVASARKSYLQYIINRTSNDPSLAFGYTDAQGRVAYDLTPRQHATLAYTEGYSDLDRSSARDRLGVNSLMGAAYHFILASAGWRYTPGEKLMVTSNLAYMRERFENSNRDGTPLGAGYYGEWAWRAAGTWAWNTRAPLDAGVSVRRLRDDGFRQQILLNPAAVRRLDEYAGTAWRSGGYLQQSWSGWNGRLHMAAGGRWDRHSIDAIPALTPQASAGLALGGTRFSLGWGQYVQYPEISQLLAAASSRHLAPERATHYAGAFEQRLGERSRLRVEFYQREDRDLLFRPLYEPRMLPDGRIFNPPANAPWRNSLRGYARGAEIFLQRRTANRLTGWVSYALGYTRLRDGATGASFPADQDQRHTVNVYGGYRLRPSVNLSVKWLYGSGFPIPGFFLRDASGRYFLHTERNRLRLDSYHRTDVRVNKSWVFDRWKLTLYGEVVNVSNTRNVRFDSFNGYNTRTGQASLSFDRMFPILPSLGVVLEK
jgi:hypothetical protein